MAQTRIEIGAVETIKDIRKAMKRIGVTLDLVTLRMDQEGNQQPIIQKDIEHVEKQIAIMSGLTEQLREELIHDLQP